MALGFRNQKVERGVNVDPNMVMRKFHNESVRDFYFISCISEYKPHLKEYPGLMKIEAPGRSQVILPHAYYRILSKDGKPITPDTHRWEFQEKIPSTWYLEIIKRRDSKQF